MKTHKRNKLWLILGLLFLVAIGGIFAYYTSSIQIDNEFYSSEAKVYLNEKFNPKDKWVPGEEKQKEVRFGNEGQIASVLRVRFIPTLKRADGMNEDNAAKSFKLNFSDEFSQEWELHGEWYYYKKVMDPSEMTGITLKSVTMSDEIGNDEHKLQTDYSGAIFEVKIESELLQASQATESAKQQGWDKIPTVLENKVIWK